MYQANDPTLSEQILELPYPSSPSSSPPVSESRIFLQNSSNHQRYGPNPKGSGKEKYDDDDDDGLKCTALCMCHPGFGYKAN
ncbi:hypothetical protein Lal_00001366 [Lupinus albus]|nr:hypothetical protein Lal_00001366 [Lupinus albus]